MQILARCPKCDAGLPLDGGETAATIRCGRCGHETPLKITDQVRGDLAVDRCPVCQGADFYTRKDFNPTIGLTLVIAGAATSAAFYWFGLDLVAYAILASAALIDLLVYSRLKDVTVCYRCHSEFRGRYRRGAAAFDLHTADVLEKEFGRRIGRR